MHQMPLALFIMSFQGLTLRFGHVTQNVTFRSLDINIFQFVHHHCNSHCKTARTIYADKHLSNC
jgi:hypothetical protein